MDLAPEPGQLDGEGRPNMGTAGAKTVSDGHFPRDKAGTSRRLRMQRRWGRQETGRHRLRGGARNAGTVPGVTRAYGPSAPDD